MFSFEVPAGTCIRAWVKLVCTVVAAEGCALLANIDAISGNAVVVVPV